MVAYDGAMLKDALEQAADNLKGRVDEINALNVFPIPDGDTGTNLHLTVQAMAKALSGLEETSVGKVMATAARATLLGARGNSGVIFSQIMRGLAKGLSARENFSCSDFAQALALASEQAYNSVMNPVEGTILTVIREASEAAQAAAQQGENLAELMRSLVARAERAVEDTQNLLPTLREAGVVDAGGQGLYYFFEGMCRVITGQSASRGSSTNTGPTEQGEAAAEYGQEVQLLIEGEVLSVEALRQRLAPLGESLLVVGDESLIRLHIHTMQPQKVLEIAGAAGALSDVSVTDLDAQAADFRQHKD